MSTMCHSAEALPSEVGLTLLGRIVSLRSTAAIRQISSTAALGWAVTSHLGV